MSTLAELRATEKDLQDRLRTAREALAAEQAKLAPIEQTISHLKGELSRVQRQMATELRQHVGAV